MKIAVIGAGAMGSIYGGHLSKENEVVLIDKDAALIEAITSKGLTLEEQGESNIYHPHAVTSSEGIGPVDLVIVFVKALFSRAALAENRHLIGEHTYLMTLQNGSGHEDILKEFAPLSHIIIGTTEDNGAVLEKGHVRHGGEGGTNIGMLEPDAEGFLPRLKEVLDGAGFVGKIQTNIQQLIWDKLFTNVSLSAVTGILGVRMGFIAGDPHAWSMTCQLLEEALTVAKALGLSFDGEEMQERVRQTSLKNPEGQTSIYADLMAGRRTEVDTISGSVVRAAKKCGIEVPTHEFVVNMVHAMEKRER